MIKLARAACADSRREDAAIAAPIVMSFFISNLLRVPDISPAPKRKA